MLPRRAAGLCAASAIATWTATCDMAHGTAPNAASCHEAPPPPPAAAAEAFTSWLEQQGANVSAIDFRPSTMDAGRFGVFAGAGVWQRASQSLWSRAASWTGLRQDDVMIASFPLSSMLCAANLAHHPRQGPLLRRLLEQGTADARSVVLLHLTVEKQRQRQWTADADGAMQGALAPWVALLPLSFSTTLFFSEQDLQALRGTTLFTATRLRQEGLKKAWTQLEPAARRLAEVEGVPGAPNFDDWLWANAVFWSRAIALPAAAGDSTGVAAHEGIVPGLDFCNHAPGSPCKWTVPGAADAVARQRDGGSPDAVSLVCPRRHMPQPGHEVTIDYGGKSNEELLFLHGLALPRNDAEVLTVMLPLPAAADEWDEQLAHRLALLQRHGLRPQLHLPAAHLAQRGKVGGNDRVVHPALPEGVAETLAVFVLEPGQVEQQLRAGERACIDAAGQGLGLAVLATLVRLLELKSLEMEGEGGTGPLEDDEKLLLEARDRLPRNQLHALHYRLGQKELARDYLIYAKRLLQEEMTRLACQQ